MACALAQHFITDYEKNKSFSGFPALGIEWQRMESPFLRKALGMKVRLLLQSSKEDWSRPPQVRISLAIPVWRSFRRSSFADTS